MYRRPTNAGLATSCFNISPHFYKVNAIRIPNVYKAYHHIVYTSSNEIEYLYSIQLENTSILVHYLLF